ncbi:hypothetical protein [Clostridium sp.]
MCFHFTVNPPCNIKLVLKVI